MFGIFSLSSLLLSCIFISITMFVVFGVIYLSGARRTYLFVSAAYFLTSIGIYLFLTEDILPNIVSLSLANSLVFLGHLILINVIVKTFKSPIRIRFQLISSLIFIILAVLLKDSKNALVCLYSISSLAICTYTILFTSKQLKIHKNYNLTVLLILNILFSIVLLARIINAVFIEDITVIYRNTFLFKLYIISYSFYVLTSLLSTLQVNICMYEKENQKLNSENITSSLAGIFNRRKFNIDFANGLLEDKYIAFIDIDNFKRINDCYGHQVGDLVISKFAKYIDFDGMFTPYRISGDEFIIVSKDLDTIDQKEEMLKNIQLDIASDKDNPALTVNASVGATINQKSFNCSKGQIMKVLDIAMYRAKRDVSRYVRLDLSNHDYKSLFNSSSFAQVVVNCSTLKVTDVNNAYIDLFAGKDKDDFIEKPLDIQLAKAIHCSDTSCDIKCDSHLYELEDGDKKFEITTKDLNGNIIVLQAEYIFSGQSKDCLAIISVKDITLQRQPQIEANQKADRLESIIESTQITLWTCDYTQNPPLVWASSNVLDYFNVSQSDDGYINYEEWTNFLKKMVGKKAMSKFENDLVDCKKAEIKFADFINQSGKSIKVDYKCHSVKLDSQGNITKAFGVCTNAEKEFEDTQVLKLRHDNLFNIYNGISCAVAIIDPLSGLVLDSNEAHQKIYSGPSDLNQNKVSFAEYLPTYQEDGSFSKDYINKQITKCVSDGQVVFEFIFKKNNKKTLNMQAGCSKAIIDGNDAIVMTTKNITEERELIESLKIIEQRYKIASKSAKLTTFRWVLSDDLLSFSNNTISIFNNQNEIYNYSTKVKQEILPEDYELYEHQIDKHIYGELDSFNAEVRIRINKQDEYQWFNIVSKVISKDDDGHAKVLAGVFMNINDHKESEARLVLKNNIDPLTGLYSASYLSEYLSTLKDTKFSVIYIRLSGLRLLNDTYGYTFGDKYINEFSQFLCRHLGEFGLCFRISGVEFVCVLLDDNSYALIHNEMLHRIFDNEVGTYLEIDGVRTRVKMNMGLVNYPGHADNIDEIVRYAETSMLLSKASINRNYTYFNRELYDKYIFQRQIVNEISIADIEAEFDMVFQPIIDIEDNTINNFEALIRWNHPQRGLMYPEDFIKPLETCGQILKVYPIMFEKVLKFIKSYHKLTNSLIPVSFNLSATTLKSSGAAEKLIVLADKFDVSLEYLYIEVTEGLFSTGDHFVAENIKELKNAGVRIIIDDFGVAYSSLHRISGITFDVLKIDKSFIDTLENRKTNVVIQMAKNLADENNAITVFEGVETEEQLARLKELGFRYFQGFYLYRPMGAATIMALSE